MNQNQLIPSRCREGFYTNENGMVVISAGLNGFRPRGENDTWHKVERSISYMVEHINQPLQVSTLAAQANISPSHFFALFKQQTGCPPMDYFTRLRMGRARRILDSTSASVKEVAAALGYDDPFYFSRVFKSVHKIPPSECRARRDTGGNDLKLSPDVTSTSTECPAFPGALRARKDVPGDGAYGKRDNPVRKVLLSIP